MNALEAYKNLNAQDEYNEYIKDLLIKEYLREGLRNGFISKQVPFINTMFERFGIDDTSKAASYWYWAKNELERMGNAYEQNKRREEAEEKQLRQMLQNTQGPAVDEELIGTKESNTDLDMQENGIKDIIAKEIIRTTGKYPAPGLQSQNSLLSAFQITPELAHRYLGEVLNEFEVICKRLADYRKSSETNNQP